MVLDLISFNLEKKIKLNFFFSTSTTMPWTALLGVKAKVGKVRSS